RQLIPNLSPTRQQLLRRSQIAWIAYRDRECRFYDSSAEGGSLQPLLSSGCKTRLTRDRTALLTRYLNGQASPNLSEDNSITEAQRQERYRQVQERLAGFQDSNYRNLRSRLLRSAEQAWQQSRTHTCRFEGSGGGNAAIAACRQWHINQRYIQLGQSLDG
ncbi:MAG: lysozyme inhibitor LprI family protein, partial [Cyanobacteria bacterium P01_H01_bin.130]